MISIHIQSMYTLAYAGCRSPRLHMCMCMIWTCIYRFCNFTRAWPQKAFEVGASVRRGFSALSWMKQLKLGAKILKPVVAKGGRGWLEMDQITCHFPSSWIKIPKGVPSIKWSLSPICMHFDQWTLLSHARIWSSSWSHIRGHSRLNMPRLHRRHPRESCRLHKVYKKT